MKFDEASLCEISLVKFLMETFYEKNDFINFFKKLSASFLA